MLFNKTECMRSTVRTQCEEKTADCWETVLGCLEELFDDADEFVVLSLADKDIKHNVRFVQSAWTTRGLTVQLGIEEKNGTRLVEKFCSQEECAEIFRKFLETSKVEDIKSYSEVKFK